jgi:hypothetical protein
MYRTAILCVLTGALMTGCGDDGQPLTDSRPPDARVDGATDHRVDAGPLPLNLSKGGTGHSDVGAILAGGQVRAGRVTQAAQLLSGPKVLGRIGDYKIYNDRVAFIIQDVRVTDGFSPFGGKLLDAARPQRPGALGQSFLGESIPTLATRVLNPSSVGVVQDGSDGQPAVIRVIGDAATMPMLASVLGENLTLAPEAYLVVDYTLAVDSEHLEIRWRLINKTTVEQQVPLTMLGLTAGDGVSFFSDGCGFEATKAGVQDFASAVGPAIGYVWAVPGKKLTPLVQQVGIWVLAIDKIVIPAAGEGEQRTLLALTDGEPEAVRRMARKLRGEAEPTAVSGVVRDPAAAPVADARVHVQTDETTPTYVTMARTSTSGGYALALKPGAYRFTVVADGRDKVAAVKVTVGATPLTQDLSVGGSGVIDYKVTDDVGAALPAKVIFKPKTAPVWYPASFGERSYPSGARQIVYSATGAGTIALVPGEYTITAARGFEYELDTVTVTLAADETQAVAFKLKRSVDTTGFMCGDFHVHAMWSPDSSDLYDEKVSSLVAEGLEIPVITEHETIADLNPTIVKLGLQPWIQGISGQEVTTFTYGHFNPYPLTRDASKPNFGAVAWYQQSPPAMFADVHATWPQAVLQVNHPRAQSSGGYFTYVGYDAKTGVAKSAGEWSRAFEAFEVFNGAGWNSYFSSTVQDWYSFLDRGFLVTATGNSDSHNYIWAEGGYPRNYVKLSTDDPTKLNLAEFSSAVKGQRVVVSGGAFITVSVGGKSLGEVANATAKKVTASIRVQAPTWVPLDTLHVIVGGVEVKAITLDKSTANPLQPAERFNQEVEVLVDKDSWLILVATGKGSLDPVVRDGEPFALTNPIYLDVDGNGVYDPPKSF